MTQIYAQYECDAMYKLRLAVITAAARYDDNKLVQVRCDYLYEDIMSLQQELILNYYYLFAIKHTVIKYTCKNYKNRQDNKAFKMH